MESINMFIYRAQQTCCTIFYNLLYYSLKSGIYFYIYVISLKE